MIFCIDTMPLKIKYTDLFELESRKKCKVEDKSLCSFLNSDIALINLVPGSDRWACSLAADGKYTVNTREND
ncbi:hypothetical protein LXL04_029743 [Taraxacum kok-saghyz]